MDSSNPLIKILAYLYNSDEPGTKPVVPNVDIAPQGAFNHEIIDRPIIDMAGGRCIFHMDHDPQPSRGAAQ